MTSTKKLLIRQTLLILSILLIGLIFGCWFDAYDYYFPLLYIITVISLMFFVPLSALYFLRIRNKKTTRGLNKIFRFVCWTFLVLLSLVFLRILFFDFFYISLPGANFAQNLWDSIKYHLSFSYINNSEYGLWPQLKEVINCLPYLMIIGLFYWAIKINKRLESENK